MITRRGIKTLLALRDLEESNVPFCAFGIGFPVTALSGHYILAALCAYGFAKTKKSRCTLCRARKYDEKSRELELNPNEWEEIDSIEIVDEVGLENILNTTQSDLKDEWMTFYKVTLKGKKQEIKNILPPKKAKEYVVSNSECDVEFNDYKATNRGWQAHSHFHTEHVTDGILFYRNYVVSKDDRMSRVNSAAHLLSFNTPKGPEIIGYNHKDTFIPLDAQNKRFLVKASRDDIVEYLLRNYF